MTRSGLFWPSAEMAGSEAVGRMAKSRPTQQSCDGTGQRAGRRNAGHATRLAALVLCRRTGYNPPGISDRHGGTPVRGAWLLLVLLLAPADWTGPAAAATDGCDLAHGDDAIAACTRVIN